MRRAARLANCSEATVRARLNEHEFKRQYETAKSAILIEACDALTARLTLATDTLCDIVDDDKTPSTVRVSACDALLRHGLRYVEVAQIIPRLERLEAQQDYNN